MFKSSTYYHARPCAWGNVLVTNRRKEPVKPFEAGEDCKAFHSTLYVGTRRMIPVPVPTAVENVKNALTQAISGVRLPKLPVFASSWRSESLVVVVAIA
jgi:hypothetical protein